MDDTFPKRVSDPAADGIPEYADDDSTAYDDVDSPRVADGPEPYPLPGDRDDGAAAIDEYGTTPEALGDALRDIGSDDPTDPVLAGDTPVDPHLGSPVSMYDRAEPGLPPSERVGRLVAPDEGTREDAEKDEIAADAGAAGGGASAEELAMHPVPEDEVA